MKPLPVKLTTIAVFFCLISGSVMWLFTGEALAASDYTMTGQTVNEGASIDPANRNAEDASYNAMVEADQYTDTNFSASSEDMTYGTAGGGAFPGSLDSDDDTRRTYTEENTGGSPPAGYITCLLPNGAGDLTQWDTAYPSGDHYLLVDDPTQDDGATYVETGTTSDIDRFTMTDLGDPGAGYTLDIQLFAVHYKGASQPCDFTCGIRIGTTNYDAYSVNPSNGGYTNQSGAVLEENPATSSEWTYSDIDNIVTYITTSDASPDVRCTRIGIVVWVNFTAATNYELDAEITFSSVGETAQTTGFNVICQGYRSGAENFGIYAYDYVALDWNLKDTIEDGSDTDYNFALTADEYDDVGDEIIIRILGLTESGDSTQDIVYLDILKVNRIEIGYALDIEVSTDAAPEYGNITLRIKGYTSAEAFQVDIYNYTAVDWDTNALQISDLGNDWQDTIDLHDTHHRDGQDVLIRFVDTVAETSDTTQDTLYLDVVWLTHYYTDPVVSNFGADPETQDEGEAVVFYLNYSDADNQAPSYVYLYIDSTDYPLSKNDSGDLTYFDGANYSLSKSDLDPGEYEYYFKVKDAESGEITTTPDTVTVNAAGNNLPYFTSTPTATGHNNTLYYYDANAVDDDGYPPDLVYDLEGNITGWASITPSTGVVQGTPTAIGDYWMNVSVTDTVMTGYVWQNTSIHIYTDAPSFVTSAITTWQNGTTYEYNAQASDPESEALVWDIEGNGTGFIDATPAAYYCMVSGPITTMGYWYLNLSITDGTHLIWQNWTLTALNSAPYFTTEPILTCLVNVSYSYSPNATDNNSDALIYSIDDSPMESLAWLTYNISSGAIEGTPTTNGSYDVNLSVMDTLGSTTWQNFSIVVDLDDTETLDVLKLLIGLIFCFGLLLAGFKERVFFLLAGPMWIICGVVIFMPYHDLFMISSVGLGIVLLFKGAYDVMHH